MREPSVQGASGKRTLIKPFEDGMCSDTCATWLKVKENLKSPEMVYGILEDFENIN